MAGASRPSDGQRTLTITPISHMEGDQIMTNTLQKQPPSQRAEIIVSRGDMKTVEQVREAVNARRGIGSVRLQPGQTYRDVALAFLQAFPLEGTPFMAPQFDEWAWSHGYLQRPASTAKGSVEWLAHLQLRHQLRYNITRASTHPEMRARGGQAFTIEPRGQGLWEVRSPQHAILVDTVAKSLERLTLRKAKRYAYLLQSADWANLTPDLQRAVEDQYRNMRDFKRRVAFEISLIDERQAEIESRIRRGIETGAIIPKNHGIALMLAADTDETNEELTVEDVQ
jgi:hypothetical protein